MWQTSGFRVWIDGEYQSCIACARISDSRMVTLYGPGNLCSGTGICWNNFLICEEKSEIRVEGPPFAVADGAGNFWAISTWEPIVPAQNLIMAVPLKVAAANSGVLLGMGDCIAVWPYLLMGAIIPVFAAPWLVGQVLGGLLGALILIRVKAGFVRYLLIGFMFFACFGLLAKALNMLGVVPPVPNWLTGLVFVIIFGVVTRAIVKFTRAAE